MADHLDYIRIAGLTSADTEVFQGIAASATATGGGVSGGSSSSGSTDWTAIPEDALDLLKSYTDDVNTWIEQVNAQTRSLSKSRGEFGAIAPYVPNVVSTLGAAGAIVATGGAALPAVASVMAMQVGLNLVGQSVQQYAATQDPNSPANLFKKAFLYDDGESILGTALLQLSEDEKSIIQDRLTKMQTALEALQYNDEEIDFGPFRARLRSKIIDYG